MDVFQLSYGLLLDYSDAHIDCLGRGGKLASIAYSTENTAMFSELGANGYNGLEYKDKEQSWYWGTE